MKDLGEVDNALGIQITHDRNNKFISQPLYVDKSLPRFNIQELKKGFLPF